jgi:hypothetical protein
MIETSVDLPVRGETLMISLRILPVVTPVRDSHMGLRRNR